MEFQHGQLLLEAIQATCYSATFKSFPIYLLPKDVTLLIEDLHSLCLLGATKTTYITQS